MAKQFGVYEILGKLGQGGMGTVFKARQPALDREVAIKVLPPSQAKDPNLVERFLREARCSAKLSHPYLVQIYDAGKEGEHYYFSMEYVEGEDLSQLRKRQGMISEAQAIPLMRKVALALGHAHSHGIVHRDVKPANILIDKKGEPKLADLGIAKPLDGGESDLTLEGKTIGTAHYISPEQVRAKPLDGRADLYSLGATFYHLVTGQTLFQAASASALFVMHCETVPVPLRQLKPEISEGFERVITKLLQKDANQRYADAAALVADLERLEQGKGLVSVRAKARRTQTHPTGPAEPNENTKKPGRPAWMIPAAIAAAVVVVIVLVLLLIPKKAPEPIPMVKVEPPPSLPKPIETKPAHQPESSTNQLAQRKAAAQEMLQFALKQWERTPDDLDGVEASLKKAEKSGEGTVVALEVQGALARLETERNNRKKQAWNTFSASIAALAKDGDFDAALVQVSAATGWPQNSIAELRTSLETQGQTVLDSSLKQVQAALEGTDFGTARKVLAEIPKIRFQSGLAKVKPQIDALNEQLATAEAKRQSDALAAWEGLAMEFVDALMAENYAEAGKKLASLKTDPAQAGIQANLERVAAVLDAVEKRKEALRTALSQLKGKKSSFDLQKRGVLNGTIESVTEKEVKLSLDLGGSGRALMTFDPAEIGPVQANRLITSIWTAKTDDDRVLQVLPLIKAKETATAKRAVETLDDHPLCPALKSKIRVLELGAAEVAAEREWQQLQTAGKGIAGLSEPQAANLMDRLDAFTKTHATSAVVKANAEGIELLRQSCLARTAKGRLLAGLILHVPFENEKNPLTFIDVSKHGETFKLAQHFAPLSATKGVVGLGLCWTKGIGKQEAPGYGFGVQIDGDFVKRYAGSKTLSMHAWCKYIGDPKMMIPGKYRGVIFGLAPFGMGGPFNVCFHFSDGTVSLQSLENETAVKTTKKGKMVLSDGAWHLISVVFDGVEPEENRYTMYVDGKLEFHAPTIRTVMPDDGGLLLTPYCHDSSPTWAYDEVRIYTRAHSITDVEAVFATGKSGIVPPAKKGAK